LPPEASGGGGSGGGRGDGDGLHDYRQQLQRYRLGLLFTIGSIVMLFIAFTTLFVARRGAGRFDPLTGGFQSDWVPLVLPMKLLLFNSVVLLLSSFTMETARRAARMEAILVPMSTIPGVRPIRESSLRWVWLTALVGTAFLAGQCLAWRQLQLHGSSLNSGPASTFFFLLTGTHAAHLVAGLAVLWYACVASGPRRSLERRCITLDVTAWYWHFIAVMWLYVLVVLVLMD
jgi:cytochrome c oxidase subunit 3